MKNVKIMLCADIPDGTQLSCARGYPGHHAFHWHLVVYDGNSLVEDLGCDGGEPEDQILPRDWLWVQDLAERMLRAEEERDRFQEIIEETEHLLNPKGW